jgi:hypothetical protein
MPIVPDVIDAIIQFVEDRPQGVTREEITLAFMAVDRSTMDQLLALLERRGIIRSQYFFALKRKTK